MNRIRSTVRPALALLLPVIFLISAADLSGAGVRWHAHLVKSEPAANDTLAKSPVAIKLWFSEKVELPVTSVKLATTAGAAVALAPLARPDTGETAPVVAALKKPLPAGSYVIKWIAAAKDGHASNGSIAFVVKAAR